MKVTPVIQKRWSGTRDPQWLYDPSQCFYVFVLVVLILDLATGGPHSPGEALRFMLACVAVLLALWGAAAISEMGTASPEPEASGDSVLASVELRGSRAELVRLLKAPSNTRAIRSVFRCGPSLAQQDTLKLAIIVFFIVVPCSGLFVKPDVRLMVIIGVTVYSVVLVEHFFSRLRYVVTSGVLTVQELRVWRVVHERKIKLEGAKVDVDFASGRLAFESSADKFHIALRELWAPHRFVAGLLAAASTEAESQACTDTDGRSELAGS